MQLMVMNLVCSHADALSIELAVSYTLFSTLCLSGSVMHVYMQSSINILFLHVYIVL